MLGDAQPPVVMGATAPVVTGPTSTTNIAATVTVVIAGETFVLGGKLDNSNIVIEYHRDFDKAVSLGSIDTIATEIGNSLNFPELGDLVKSTHDSIGQLPVVGGIVNAIETATVRITDLVINTATKTYGVGLALDFTTSTPLPTLFGITLVSLGFSVTRVNNNQAAAHA